MEKQNKEKLKNSVIVVAALVLPGGLAALGIWKAVELIRKKKKANKQG